MSKLSVPSLLSARTVTDTGYWMLDAGRAVSAVSPDCDGCWMLVAPSLLSARTVTDTGCWMLVVSVTDAGYWMVDAVWGRSE